MHLTRFDPFRELDDLSTRLNTWFGQPMRRAADENGASFSDWVPALDVEESDAEYLIKADRPAMKKNDLRIHIEDGMLTLEGERKHEKEETKKKYHRVERSYGRFMRRIGLPSDVDQQKVKAEFADGVLHVHLPKSAEARPTSVEVKVN